MSALKVNGIEELKGLAGKDLGASSWFEVSQQRIQAFADATGDQQWIHVDEERCAKESPFGKTIAHGYLTLSVFPELFGELLEVSGVRMALNYGLNRLRFPAPVPSGSRIRAKARVAAVEELAGNGVQLTVEAAVEVEGSEKPSLIAELLYRYYGG